MQSFSRSLQRDESLGRYGPEIPSLSPPVIRSIDSDGHVYLKARSQVLVYSRLRYSRTKVAKNGKNTHREQTARHSPAVLYCRRQCSAYISRQRESNLALDGGGRDA